MENVLWPIMRTIPVSNSPSEAEIRIFEMKTSTPGKYFPGAQLTSKASPDLFRLWRIRLQCSKGSKRDIVGVFVGCLKKVPILSVRPGNRTHGGRTRKTDSARAYRPGYRSYTHKGTARHGYPDSTQQRKVFHTPRPSEHTENAENPEVAGPFAKYVWPGDP